MLSGTTFVDSDVLRSNWYLCGTQCMYIVWHSARLGGHEIYGRLRALVEALEAVVGDKEAQRLVEERTVGRFPLLFYFDIR